MCRNLQSGRLYRWECFLLPPNGPCTPRTGTFVAVRGTVDDLRHLTGGHLSVTVGGATVFIPARVSDRLDLKEGLNVSVAGTVQTYLGEKEIVVQFPGDVAVT